VLAGFIGVFTRLYGDWTVDPTGFLPAYRRRCTTLGMQVRIERPGDVLAGTAVDISGAGHLIVESEGKTVDVAAGDVHHVRH
jgi:BirA family biotin operon repressor/biotin-[acetyl-CoA-carboxylase] ligase